MSLTDLAIRTAKPGGSIRKLSDGGGLQLHVTPTGSKLWRLAYRYAGKQRQLAIGVYPSVSLQDARTAREDARQILRAGRDPSVKKRLDRIAAANSAANTFAAIADDLIAKKEAAGRADQTLSKTKWLLDMARDALGPRPIREIAAAEVLAVLTPVQRSGRRETARRLRATIGQVFRHAIATARADNDPTLALRDALAAPVIKHRPAITDPVAFGELLRAIEGMEQSVTRFALQLLAILFPRPGDLRQAEWHEFNLADAAWTVPASRMKVRREHVAPLPRQAIDILRELHGITGGGRLVFPSVRSTARPMSEGTLNAALRRLGYSQDQMCPHGFRASFSTIANESGRWHADAIEHALAHLDRDEVRRAYARGRYWDERVRMAQWWADKLDALRDGGKVVAMKSRG